MADGPQFPPRPDFYRAARATRLETAIRATPSNPQRRVAPSAYLASGGGAGRERRNRVGRGPPRRVAPYSPLGRRAWWPARCRWRSGEYVSVSSQRDSEKSLLARDRRGAGDAGRGVGRTGGDIRGQGRYSADRRASRRRVDGLLQAAGASAASFTVGSLLPLLAIWLPPETFGFPSHSSPC
jgi:hypothetical protein